MTELCRAKSATDAGIEAGLRGCEGHEPLRVVGEEVLKRARAKAGE
jgi:hypothetical protein